MQFSGKKNQTDGPATAIPVSRDTDFLLSELRHYVSNDLPKELAPTVSFIVGSNPSNGARSPSLWNSAFTACGLNGAMYPLDVSNDNLHMVLHLLEQDSRVIGVAIAAPYKSLAASFYPGRLSATSRMSESINLLYRDEVARFVGENTDGLAAVASLKKFVSELEECSTLVLGCGGTGRAVIAQLSQVVQPELLQVAFKNPRHKTWIEGIGISAVPWTELDFALQEIDVLVNCTSVGWGDQVDYSPLSEFQVASLGRQTVIFDVIYQPPVTKLLEIAQQFGLRTLNGSQMNLLQAVIAMETAVGSTAFAVIESAMRSSFK